MKCILAGMSSFAIRSLVFSAPLHFWTLRLFESLYVYYNKLILKHLSTWGWPWKRAPKNISVKFCLFSMKNSVWHIHWHGYFGVAWEICPGLLYRALPCNIGEFYAGNLLPSLMSMIIKAIGVFDHLEKSLQCLFGLFCDFWCVLSHLV